MLQENKFDFAGWWNEQSFSGKELFKITDTGTLLLNPVHFIKERSIADFSAQSADATLKTLQDRFTFVDTKMIESETEWNSTDDKLKFTEKIDILKDYLQKIVAVGNFEKYAAMLMEWEKAIHTIIEENYKAKLQLVLLAEGALESTNWKESAQLFKDISEKWKHAGYVEKFRNEKLWARIEAARQSFHERKRISQDDEEKEMMRNLDLKMEIVEQAEALANSEDWKKTTEDFLQLLDKWKSIGRTINKKNEELWQQLLAAKQVFFDRKKAHFGKIQEEQENNYIIKSAIAEKAVALQDSTEWNATTQAFATLAEEWKKTGKVPNEKSDELWKKYTEAQDKFFEAKRKYNEENRQILEANYNLKLALLKRAEEIKESFAWGEVTVEMNKLLDEWKKIGTVPKAHSQRIWEEFIAARKHFFARKDANKEKKKQQEDERKQKDEEYKVMRQKQDEERKANLTKQEEDRKAAIIKQAQDGLKDLIKAIEDEKENIEHFKTSIENITPSKKAAELRAHLENLIVESTHNLKKLEDKLNSIQKKQASYS